MELASIYMLFCYMFFLMVGFGIDKVTVYNRITQQIDVIPIANPE